MQQQALMRKTTSRPKIRLSSETPKLLRRAYKRLKSCRKIADEIKINVAYVYRALHYGERPANPSIARKLGFQHIAPRFGDHRTRHMRAWDRLSPQQKHQVVFDWFHHGYDDEAHNKKG